MPTPMAELVCYKCSDFRPSLSRHDSAEELLIVMTLPNSVTFKILYIFVLLQEKMGLYYFLESSILE